MPDPTSRPTSRRGLLAFLVAASVVHFAHRNLPFALLPSLRDDLGLSYSDRALLATGFYVAFGFAAIPLGWVADRVGRRLMLVVGMVVWIAATAASALAPTIGLLVALRALVGIGQATFQPTSMALLAGAYPEDRRARVLGVLNLGTLAGVVAGLGLGGAVGLWLGWRGAFVAYAGVGGLLLPLTIWTLRRPRRGQSPRQAPPTPAEGQGLAAVVRQPAMRWLLLSGVCLTFCVGGIGVFLVNYVEERFHLDQGTAALAGGSVGILSAVVGTVLGAWLADRLHARRAGGRPILIGASALAAVPLGCAGLLADRLSTFAIVFGLFGVLMSMYAGPIVAAIQGRSPAALQATVVAVYITSCRLLGDGPSPLAAGAVADAAGDLRAGLLLVILALLPAGLFALLAARTLEKGPAEIPAGPR